MNIVLRFFFFFYSSPTISLSRASSCSGRYYVARNTPRRLHAGAANKGTKKKDDYKSSKGICAWADRVNDWERARWLGVGGKDTIKVTSGWKSIGVTRRRRDRVRRDSDGKRSATETKIIRNRRGDGKSTSTACARDLSWWKHVIWIRRVAVGRVRADRKTGVGVQTRFDRAKIRK